MTVDDCAADQACGGGGTCEFVCNGVDVPSEEPSIDAAIAVVAAAGGTVCIAPGSYAAFSIDAPAGRVELVGTGAHQVTVLGDSLVRTADATHSGIRVRGMTLDRLRVESQGDGDTIDIDDVKLLANDTGVSRPFEVRVVSGTTDVRYRRCDIATTASADVEDVALYIAAPGDAGSAKVSVLNSYVHDSDVGVRLALGACGGANAGRTDLRLANCTLVAHAIAALDASAGDGDCAASDVRYTNNVFTLSGVGVRLAVIGSITSGHNAYFANTIDTDGATINAGDVTADPLLDYTALPPKPGIGSGLLGEANFPEQLDDDFWQTPRVLPSDIGCIEVP